MARKWYPVVDYLECIECGSCIAKCSHGVYDKAKAPSPLVISPDGCVDHCHGCGALCPTGAITYVGEDTGWTPPNGQKTEESCCCSCGCDSSSNEQSIDKRLSVDFMYLDLQTCDRCMGTDEVIVEAIRDVEHVLSLAGYDIELNKIEISDEKMAEEYEFLASPTIRINGTDICLEVKENACGTCSDISGQSTDCRLFVYEGKEYEVPPKAMLINAMLRTVYGPIEQASRQEQYMLPDNLKRFFEGKRNGVKGQCCGGKVSCC
jgi:NAD-dependent dihydropyrimidine dehydrogenase PreA subunit